MTLVKVKKGIFSNIRDDVRNRAIDIIKDVARGHGDAKNRVNQSMQSNHGCVKKRAYIAPVDRPRKQPGSKKSLKVEGEDKQTG